MTDQTRAEAILSDIKNHPRVAWLVVVGTVLLVVAELIGAFDEIRNALFPLPPAVEWSLLFALPWELQPTEEHWKPARNRHNVIFRPTVTNRGSHPATILDTGFLLGQGDSQWDPVRSSVPFDKFTLREGEVKAIEISMPFELPPGQPVFPRTATGGIMSETENGIVPIGLYILSSDSRGENHGVYFPIAYGQWEGRRFVEIVPLTERTRGFEGLTTIELLMRRVIMPSEVVGRWRNTLPLSETHPSKP